MKTISIKEFLALPESELKKISLSDLAFTEKELLDYVKKNKGGPGSGWTAENGHVGSGHTDATQGEGEEGQSGEPEHVHTPMGNRIEVEKPKPVIENHPDEEKKNNISIKRSTEKAHLITDGKKDMWIQKRWLRADGTLTPSAQAKWDAQPTNDDKKAEWIEKTSITDDNGEQHHFNIWKPNNDMGRAYFKDKSYIQVSSKDNSPQGYYESHRYAKGESVTRSFITASGGTAEKVLPNITKDKLNAFIPSGQNRAYVKIGDKWSEL